MGKGRCEPIRRQLGAITRHPRYAHRQRRPLPHGVDPRDRLGRLRLDLNRLRSEIERDAQDVGIFGIEQLVPVGADIVAELIGLPTQAASHHLLAQKLGAEGAHAEDVGHRVGVPAFREHRDRHHATHLFAQPPLRPTVFITSRRSRCRRRRRPMPPLALRLLLQDLSIRRRNGSEGITACPPRSDGCRPEWYSSGVALPYHRS